jgi:septal ring factor EnvC (AmiA/AmiB activator)
MDIQNILNAIKDYGAAIISTISVGGVAAAVGIIVKIKKAFDDTKEKMNKALAKKEEAEGKLTERYSELTTMIKDQNTKLDTLTEEVSRVKGNRKN